MKVKSLKKLGHRRVFSIEMKGEQHNYITARSNAVHKNSHVNAYILISYQSLWLKKHFPAEWWAARMSDCHPEQVVRYMGIARAEGTQFGEIDCDRLTQKFSVYGEIVTPGLTSIKGVGTSASERIARNFEYANIDDFIEKNGKDKNTMERLIKLGAFKNKHTNKRALWIWYLVTYCSGTSITALKYVLKAAYGWTEKEILSERERKLSEYLKQNPKRKKTPPAIEKWVPSIPTKKPRITELHHHLQSNKNDVNDVENLFRNIHLIADSLSITEAGKKFIPYSKKIELNFDIIYDLIQKDYTLEEQLEFEKEFLGYFWHSPMDVFESRGFDISAAKKQGILECVIEKCVKRSGKTDFLHLYVTDGIENIRVAIWQSEIETNGRDVFKEGNGLLLHVKWSDRYNSFSMKSKTTAVKLRKRKE